MNYEITRCNFSFSSSTGKPARDVSKVCMYNSPQSMQNKNSNDKITVPSLVAALKQCGRFRDLATGKQVHRRAIESKLFTNIVVANTVINMYAKCGGMTDAHRVFDTMPRRDVVSWNCLLQGYVENGENLVAIKLFDIMKCSYVPDSRTYIFILTACANLANTRNRDMKWLEKARDIHDQAVKNGKCDLFVQSRLICMYAKFGSMLDACRVFNSMSSRDIVSWNALLQGYVETGESYLVLELLHGMDFRPDGCVPDARTYVVALSACATLASARDGEVLKWLETGKDIQSRAVSSGFSSDVFVQTTLVDMYAKCRNMSYAKNVFDKMVKHDTIAWNSLLQGYVENRQHEFVLELFEDMQKDGCVPNARSFAAALTACGALVAEDVNTWIEKGRALHSGVVSNRCCDTVVLNLLINMYSQAGNMVEARFVFDDMIELRDTISWTALLQGYVNNGGSESALELYNVMNELDMLVDARAFVAALTACTDLAAKSREQRWLLRGKAVHSRAMMRGCMNNYVENTLMNMYATCRSIKHAFTVFDNMVKPDVISWNCLTQGCVENGENQMALELISEDMEVKPDSTTFAVALSLCGNLHAIPNGRVFHAQVLRLGLEGDALVLASMEEFYGKCGNMHVSKLLFDSNHVKDIRVWNTLLSVYTQLGETKNVFELFKDCERQGVPPNEVTFTHLLTVCSNSNMCGEGMKYLEIMQVKYGMTPNIIHYTCVVDLLARGNHLEGALGVMRKMSYEADAVMWRSVLSAARKWDNVVAGRIAYQHLLRLDGDDPAGHVLMSNIYRGST